MISAQAKEAAVKMNKYLNNIYADDPSTSEKGGMPKRWFFSRIICFLLALGVWIYVVNITTQDFEKTFNLIDINIEGREELEDNTNMSVVNLEESKVSITVKGLRSDISKLTEKDFSAYIDVSNLEENGKHTLEVSVNLPNTVSLVSRYPEAVTVSIDENIERQIAVDIDVTEYSIDTIYEMGKPTSDVRFVTVKGPSDVINRIKAAKVYINLGTVMTSTVIRTEAVLVDKAGNPVDSAYLTIDNKSVTVTVPVTMEKTISLVCNFLPGITPDAYSSISVSPNTVKVKGDPKILNELDSVSVYALDGNAADKQVSFDSLLFPGGVELVSAPEYVRIVAELVEITTVPEDTTTEQIPETTDNVTIES